MRLVMKSAAVLGSCLAILGAMGCEGEFIDNFTVSGTVLLADGSTIIKTGTTVVDISLIDEDGTPLSNSSGRFALNPQDGSFTTLINSSPVLEANQVTLRARGSVGVLIWERLTGLVPSVQEAVAEELVIRCDIPYESGWYPQAMPEKHNEGSVVTIALQQAFVVNLTPSQFAAIQQCQTEELPNILQHMTPQ